MNNPKPIKVEVPIEDIITLSKQNGSKWFSQENMQFFRTRLPTTAIQVKTRLGYFGYFITSEKFVGSRGRSNPRKYTVRKFNYQTKDINTVGEFNEIPTKHQAEKFLETIIEGLEIVS